MGYGDQLIGSGMAKGAASRGKRVAFGDGEKILWDRSSGAIFRSNPNVAPPGSEGAADLEWIAYYKGRRIYNRHDRLRNRWVWNMDFRPASGEVYFDAHERRFGERFGKGFVLIEPNVEAWKSVAPNKDWGLANYQALADQLHRDGLHVGQFVYDRRAPRLKGVEHMRTTSFRDALSVLAYASLYVGPEGGLHHGAAAVDVPAVVLFGGFIPPAVTGYGHHANLTGGAEACGSLAPCQHCRDAMKAISVDEVHAAAMEFL